MKKRRCPYCGNLYALRIGESFAFCESNPKREEARTRYYNGDKRYTRPAPYVVTAVIVPPSPKDQRRILKLIASIESSKEN